MEHLTSWLLMKPAGLELHYFQNKSNEFKISYVQSKLIGSNTVHVCAYADNFMPFIL